MKVLDFNKEEYPFKELVEDLYDIKLNELDDNLDHKEGTVGADTDSVWHKTFYNKIREGYPEFVSLYKKFIQNFLKPLFVDEEKLIYQKLPSFRVCQPGGKAVYIPHYDGDALHKHPPGEINIFMPLTKAYGNNSMYLESIPGLGDFKSVDLDYGDVLMFYGNRQRHFNKYNDTGKTRCSFDFRVIPPVNYDESYDLESATMKNKFAIGGYYDIV